LLVCVRCACPAFVGTGGLAVVGMGPLGFGGGLAALVCPDACRFRVVVGLGTLGDHAGREQGGRRDQQGDAREP
jgi:hypothetical protein